MSYLKIAFAAVLASLVTACGGGGGGGSGGSTTGGTNTGSPSAGGYSGAVYNETLTKFAQSWTALKLTAALSDVYTVLANGSCPRGGTVTPIPTSGALLDSCVPAFPADVGYGGNLTLGSANIGQFSTYPAGSLVSGDLWNLPQARTKKYWYTMAPDPASPVLPGYNGTVTTKSTIDAAGQFSINTPGTLLDVVAGLNGNTTYHLQANLKLTNNGATLTYVPSSAGSGVAFGVNTEPVNRNYVVIISAIAMSADSNGLLTSPAAGAFRITNTAGSCGVINVDFQSSTSLRLTCVNQAAIYDVNWNDADMVAAIAAANN